MIVDVTLTPDEAAVLAPVRPRSAHCDRTGCARSDPRHWAVYQWLVAGADGLDHPLRMELWVCDAHAAMLRTDAPPGAAAAIGRLLPAGPVH